MKKFVFLIVAVFAAFALWTGGWFYAAGEIRSAVASLGEADGETNPKITCATLNVTGFPFRFDLDCVDATVVSGDLTLGLAGLRASVLAYNPTQARLSARAPMTIADAFSGAQSRVDFSAADGSARLVTEDFWAGLSGEGWRVARISLVAEDVAWTDTLVGETQVMAARHVEAHLLDIPEQHDPAAGTAALAAYAALTETAAPALGISDGEATLEAELTGLPDDLRKLAADDVVRSWQAAGGQLKLVGLKGSAGEEFVETTGTIGLDSAARLDGQIAVKSKGLVERIGGLLPENLKPLVVGGQEADGSYSQTLTIKAGVVFSGLMPVAMIPPLM
jgi:hypothetical protein